MYSVQRNITEVDASLKHLVSSISVFIDTIATQCLKRFEEKHFKNSKTPSTSAPANSSIADDTAEVHPTG